MKSIREIGELLKNARTKKGLAIEKVYKKTHIYPGILKALEEGKVEDLLNKVYTKAFLKKYSEFLGLDKDFILREYNRLFPEQTESKVYIDKEEPPKDIMKYFNVSLSVVIVIVFIIFASITVSKIKIFFLNKAKRTIASVSEKKTEHKIVEKLAVAPLPSQISLSIKSSDDVWMKVERDGEIVFKGILPKGSQESWVSENRFDLRVGKLENLTFTVNNKNFENIGNGVKNITIDKEGIKIGKKKIR